MTTQSTTDVLISGAGAAGLTLAIELARRGVRFRIVDRLATPFPGSRGKGIQPRTQEVFEDLGILDHLVALGGLYPPARQYANDGSFPDVEMGERIDPTPAEPYQLPLMVPQVVTERVLRARLAELGHAVDFGHELVEFAQTDDGVTAMVRAGDGDEVITCRYLIGADGGRSTVRKALGVDFPGRTLGARAIVADVALSGLDRTRWHQHHPRDMSRGLHLCPLAGTDLFQLQAAFPGEGPADLSPEGLTQLLADRTGRADLVVHAVSWASDYRMNARLADRYRVGRVFLVGDAAHVHPPTGGQGLNTSVQDAYNLGWKLAAALSGAGESLLDTYEIERRPIAEEVLGLSQRLLAAQRDGTPRRGREVRQLDLGYRESPLSLERSAREGHLRAGDRAPDAPVRGAAGAASRLFLLYRGSHWTLLVQDGPPTGIAPRPGLRIHTISGRGDVIDAFGHVRDAYALAPGERVLIRPDGYIGAFAGADDEDALEAYLSAMGLTASVAAVA